jgi:flagellar hook-associated protein 3 FlgL
MFPNITGASQRYLADLDRTTTAIQRAQAQVSSGLRLQAPSDDPAAAARILELQTQIAGNTQVQANLGTAKTEVDTADGALQSAVQVVENAISLAAQGANSTATAAERSNIADQISGLQQTLVSITQTTVNGRYIFSGDQDNQPAYQLDSSQPNGVSQLISSPATRVIADANGISIALAKTAGEIFDARNPDNTNASGNVFAAINSLRTALLNNDQAGIAQATDMLHAADEYLNSQLTFYGAAQNRIADGLDLAQKYQTQQQADLSQVRDADIPTVAVQLNQAQVQQQAALSVEATVLQTKNLFDYMA